MILTIYLNDVICILSLEIYIPQVFKVSFEITQMILKLPRVEDVSFEIIQMMFKLTTYT